LKGAENEKSNTNPHAGNCVNCPSGFGCFCRRADNEYLRIARKKGILRWDMKLAPNTVEKDATVVKYSFTMEYDRNMQIQPRR